ncbi:MAG: energy transducer TonB [Candidatus Acidiferrales bacterium]
MTRDLGRQSVITSYSLPVFLVLAFALLITSPLNAQQPEINVLAARVAGEFPKADEGKKVIVFDFIGPGEKDTALGQKIAEDFRNALSKSSAGLIIIDSSMIIAAFDNYPVSYQSFEKPELELWLAKKLGADLIVSGKLQKDKENLALSLNAYQANGTAIQGFKIKFPMTDQMKSLMHISAATDPHEPAGDASIDKKQRSYPTCTYCPYASFSSEAVKHHTQGTVILGVLVGADGVAHNVSVLKALPNGLTESAIETVRSWRFRPAIGSNGTPVEHKTIIEVVFHLTN